MNVEARLRQSLLPVFGFNSVDQIPEDAALVKDLGADSLDFVEIVCLIERDFGVVLKTNELVFAGISVSADTLFVEGKLTEEGTSMLKQQLPDSNGRFKTGMTKVDLFQSITVRDLANIIRQRKPEEENKC
ncbi:MAG TPA: phosphopantetheine-binding protein [Nitrospirota bacterium]|nr:phosphopantetheine-binding protein [Nitrospirota bacterium]